VYVAGCCSVCCRVSQCVLQGVAVCVARCCSVCCKVLQCVCCKVLQCVCCSVCVAVCVLQCVCCSECVVGCHKTSYVAFVTGCHTYDMCLVRVAACCSVLQCVLQGVAVRVLQCVTRLVVSQDTHLPDDERKCFCIGWLQ